MLIEPSVLTPTRSDWSGDEAGEIFERSAQSAGLSLGSRYLLTGRLPKTKRHFAVLEQPTAGPVRSSLRPVNLHHSDESRSGAN